MYCKNRQSRKTAAGSAGERGSAGGTAGKRRPAAGAGGRETRRVAAGQVGQPRSSSSLNRVALLN